MRFNKATEGHAAMMGAFLSDNGQYKVVQYGKEWYAYFKPAYWNNFGNSCRKTHARHCVKYSSRQEAQMDCEHHYTRFGNSPAASDRLPAVD